MKRAPDTPSHPEPEGDREALRRRNRELEILNAVAADLNASVDLDSLLRRALAGVTDLMGLETGWVFLLDEAEVPYLAAVQNLPRGLADEPRLLTGSCYCLDSYLRGDLGAANVDVVTCTRLKKLVDGTDGLRFHASIALHARGRRLGVLNVASAQWQRLDDGDLRLLRTVGDLLAIAVERARLHERSQEQGAAEERNRLAREIHDTLAQGLAAIALQLETAEALWEQQDAAEGSRSGERRERIRRATFTALDLARQNLEEARRSVLDLRAAPLEGRSLPEALASLVGKTARGTSPDGPRITFDGTDDGRPLPRRVEAGVYRIAQEALGNAVRHAGAANIRVNLEVDSRRLRLRVIDDGRGFSRREVGEGCFGLLGLEERARLLGGELRLESSPGAGTTLTVRAPLAR